MAYVQDENDALTNRQLEVQRLQQLGIDIYDGTLHSRAVDVNALDLSSRLAHARWKELYNLMNINDCSGRLLRSLKITTVI
jgi:hypothetical protein